MPAAQHRTPLNLHALPNATASRGTVLVVDDDIGILRVYERVLKSWGFAVQAATNGAQATEMLSQNRYDAVISDIQMPDIDGVQLLQLAHRVDSDLPVILVTGGPQLASAIDAVEHGARHYLLKPVDAEALRKAIDESVAYRAEMQSRRAALELVANQGIPATELPQLSASFDRALDKLWIAFQPIVSFSRRAIHGYEALVRSDDKGMPHPGALFFAAERLGRLVDLGRAIRSRVCSHMESVPTGADVFLNLHPLDLLDDTLLDPSSPLSKVAPRLVLEITERAALEEVPDALDRVAQLKKLGFRIAVDDLGAGYAGLTSLAQLEPHVVKLDMALIRNVHLDKIRQKVIRSIAMLCFDMNLQIVAEGVETAEERDTVIQLGCNLQQGYLFAKPSRPFPSVNW